MEAPQTRYARSDGAYIAYRIVGSGPVDLVLLQGGFSHVELQLEEPSFARFLGRLASFSRLIVLDVRGTGLSDRTMHLPTLEDQVDDVLAVLDAVGCERAALFGLGQGGVLACVFSVLVWKVFRLFWKCGGKSLHAFADALGRVVPGFGD